MYGFTDVVIELTERLRDRWQGVADRGGEIVLREEMGRLSFSILGRTMVSTDMDEYVDEERVDGHLEYQVGESRHRREECRHDDARSAQYRQPARPVDSGGEIVVGPPLQEPARFPPRGPPVELLAGEDDAPQREAAAVTPFRRPMEPRRPREAGRRPWGRPGLAA